MSDSEPASARPPRDADTDELTLLEAVREGLWTALARDETVMLLGEDIGETGGVFRATEGLIDEFGPDRVVDTPLSEIGIVATAIGLAEAGLRPIAELQFMGFTYPAVDQLFNRAARLHTRTRGHFNCPLVVRAPFGGGIRAPDLHGESMEAIFVHHPGLKVIAPSTPTDAKGLIAAAVHDPDPVIVLEPKKIYRSIREPVPKDPYEIPIGEAHIRRDGADVSVFTWGAMTQPTLRAAEELDAEIDVEVVDLRSLSPIDRETIVESFKKTGRGVVVHEAPRTGGLAGEITAIIQEEALLYQEAPITRVTGYDVVYPLYELEDYQLPNPTRIREGIRAAVEF